MSLLIECASSRWADFLTIPDDDIILTSSNEETDLFVGKNKRMTITLINETKTKFRDVVVLGELIINSSNPENKDVKPELIARDFFIPGSLSMNNIYFQCRNLSQFENIETFRSELQKLFLECMDIQRETVEWIGLKSILV